MYDNLAVIFVSKLGHVNCQEHKHQTITQNKETRDTNKSLFNTQYTLSTSLYPQKANHLVA